MKWSHIYESNEKEDQPGRDERTASEKPLVEVLQVLSTRHALENNVVNIIVIIILIIILNG